MLSMVLVLMWGVMWSVVRGVVPPTHATTQRTEASAAQRHLVRNFILISIRSPLLVVKLVVVSYKAVYNYNKTT